MICVFPTYDGDVYALHALLRYITELGDVRQHNSLIVADAGTQWSDITECKQAAARIFRNSWMTTNEVPTTGWIEGPASLFFQAAHFIECYLHEPWLWLETDALPIKPGFLDTLESAYAAGGQPFMGHFYTSNVHPEWNGRVMSGVAVYPPDAWTRLKDFEHSPANFDLAIVPVVSMAATRTNLIQHFYGRKDLAPSFAGFRTSESPANLMTPADFHPDAVVFHRCKDGTLMNLMSQRMHPQNVNLLVVLAFCAKDANLMQKSVEWMRDMGQQPTFQCLLSYDSETRGETVSSIEKAARQCFYTVRHFQYGAPHVKKWPNGANVAFQETARHVMKKYASPFLWLEPDAVALKPDWIAVLFNEYKNSGKRWMGPIVDGLGHQNGVGIYPGDMAARCPRAMTATDAGWDIVMKPEMMHDFHNAGHLIQHGWGMVNRRLHSHTGPAPVFANRQSLSLLKPGAVLFHRVKDGSLINRLREK